MKGKAWDSIILEMHRYIPRNHGILLEPLLSLANHSFTTRIAYCPELLARYRLEVSLVNILATTSSTYLNR